MSCSVDTDHPQLKQFLLNTMAMQEISPQLIVASIGSFYATLGRHFDALGRVRDASDFIRATQPDKMAGDASALSRYRTLATDIIPYISDMLEWTQRNRTIIARINYDVGEPVTHMSRTIAMDVVSTGLEMMRGCWTTSLDPALRDGTISSDLRKLDQLRDLVLESHNIHNLLRHNIALTLPEACHFKDFSRQHLEEILASSPHSCHGINRSALMMAANRIIERRQVRQGQQSSQSSQLEDLGSVLSQLQELLESARHGRGGSGPQ